MNTKSITSEVKIAGWFEKDIEREAFLNLVNFEGFILEESVREILLNGHQSATLHSGDIFAGAPHRGGGRVEIDLWVQIDNFVFDIEAKRSDYDWVFLQNPQDKSDLHLITGPGLSKKLAVKNCSMPKITCVSKQVVEVQEIDETQTLVRKSNTGEKNKPSSGVPARSNREEYVHNAVRQSLFNIETLIHSQLNDDKWVGQAHRIFIPVIVTNAKLLAATYSKSDINSRARLTKLIDIKPVPYAAITHAEILRFGPDFRDEIVHVGRPPSGPLNLSDERYKDTHNKTVFVVSQSHILDFVNYIMNATKTAFQNR